MKKPPQTYKPYPSDISDEEWAFVVPYLTLCRLDAEQRDYAQSIRESGKTVAFGIVTAGGVKPGAGMPRFFRGSDTGSNTLRPRMILLESEQSPVILSVRVTTLPQATR